MTQKLKNFKKYQSKKVRLDPLYHSLWFSKFINKFMINGNKSAVENLVHQCLLKIKIKTQRDPLKLLYNIILKHKPLLGFISKRLGPNWKKIPVPLAPRLQVITALKLVVNHTRTEVDRTFAARLTRVFTNFVKARRTALTAYSKQHRQNLVRDRVNTRFRWH